MVRGVRALGMEACLTAGMLSEEQADDLKAAGLSAYNHNIDTSKEFYGESSVRVPSRIVFTRSKLYKRLVSLPAAEGLLAWVRRCAIAWVC